MNEKKSFLVDLAETIDRHLPQRNAQQDASSPYPGRLRRLLRWLTPNGGTLLLSRADPDPTGLGQAAAGSYCCAWSERDHCHLPGPPGQQQWQPVERHL